MLLSYGGLAARGRLVGSQKSGPRRRMSEKNADNIRPVQHNLPVGYNATLWDGLAWRGAERATARELIPCTYDR